MYRRPTRLLVFHGAHSVRYGAPWPTPFAGIRGDPIDGDALGCLARQARQNAGRRTRRCPDVVRTGNMRS